MSDKDNIKDIQNKENRSGSERAVTADTRNSVTNRGRSVRVRDQLDLDFEYDFMKKQKPQPQIVTPSAAGGKASAPSGNVKTPAKEEKPAENKPVRKVISDRTEANLEDLVRNAEVADPAIDTIVVPPEDEQDTAPDFSDLIAKYAGGADNSADTAGKAEEQSQTEQPDKTEEPAEKTPSAETPEEKAAEPKSRGLFPGVTTAKYDPSGEKQYGLYPEYNKATGMIAESEAAALIGLRDAAEAAEDVTGTDNAVQETAAAGVTEGFFSRFLKSASEKLSSFASAGGSLGKKAADDISEILTSDDTIENVPERPDAESVEDLLKEDETEAGPEPEESLDSEESADAEKIVSDTETAEEPEPAGELSETEEPEETAETDDTVDLTDFSDLPEEDFETEDEAEASDEEEPDEDDEPDQVITSFIFTGKAAAMSKSGTAGTNNKKKTATTNKSNTKKPAAKKTAVKTAKPVKSASNSKGTAKKVQTNKPKASKPKTKPAQAKNPPAPAKVPADTGSNKPVKTKKKRSKVWIFFRSLIITLISLGILGGIAGGAYTAYVISHADNIHPERIYDSLAVSSYIYDDQDKLIDEIYYNENRQIISYERLPDNLKNAFIAIEDKTFWTHKGFNFRRIVGAILERFKGGRISGTSTITQQLARNIFLPEDKSVRSIKRKITEMYYAYQIEQVLTKEEILTAYLNTIYLGYGCYGVDTASRTYFNVDVEDLTLEQCAALAALPQAPGSYALLVTEKGENTTRIKKRLYANDTSQERRNLVLALMEEQGYITAEEREAATKPLADFINPGGAATTSTTSAFKDYLIETVTHDLMEAYDLSEEQATKIIYTKGLRIHSTLDSQAQRVITKEFKKSENFPSTGKKGVVPEAAMVITQIGTGEVKAMVGTRKADGDMLFNRATNPRQPGSSIKPLTVYAAALQKSYEYQKKGETFKFKDTGYDKQGVNGWGSYLTVSSLVVDEKMTVNGKTWPLNVTRTYSGNNTFRTAIQKSINTCAVKILAQVGISYSMDMLKDFGITTAIDDSSQAYNDLNYAALGLGAMTEGVTPLEMSLAYAAFPNGGKRNTAVCYTTVEDSNGRVILEGKSQSVRVMNEGVAWIMTNVLQSIVTNGIGYPAAVDGIKVGGKTGTTDSRYDIWFDGFTPSYSVALWIGTDNNVQMDSYSDKAAALWGKIVGKVKRAKKGEYRGMPKNVFRAWNGEFYTNGTAPPEPPPEPEEDEEDEEGKDGKDAKAGEKTDAAKKSDAAPAPAGDKSKDKGKGN